MFGCYTYAVTYKLFITHPNDMIHKPWRWVADIEDYEDVPHHIASPNFEWSYGTCVKVTHDDQIIGAGAYSNSEFIRININLFNEWTKQNNARLILLILSPLVSSHMMATLGCACVRSFEDITQPTTYGLGLLEAVEQYGRREVGAEDEIEQKRTILRAQISPTQDIDAEIYHRLSFVRMPGYHQEVVWLPGLLCHLEPDLNKDYLQLVMARGIVQRVPFYDVIKEILDRHET